MLNAVIDISHFQTHVDFGKLKAAGIVGVIHKATQGTRMVDPRYASRRELAIGAGLLWGAYHFGIDADGSDQADHFLETAKPNRDTLVALDYEPNPRGGTMKAPQALEFLAHAEANLDRWPGLYTGAAMAGRFPRVPQCWLWWAQYNTRPTRIPTDIWETWTLWQYTDGAAGPAPRYVEGVGFCDRDQFNGTLDGLRRLWLNPRA